MGSNQNMQSKTKELFLVSVVTLTGIHISQSGHYYRVRKHPIKSKRAPLGVIQRPQANRQKAPQPWPQDGAPHWRHRPKNKRQKTGRAQKPKTAQKGQGASPTRQGKKGQKGKKGKKA